MLTAALLRVQEAITDSELTPRQVVERLDKFIVGQVGPALPVSLLLSGASMLTSFVRRVLARFRACMQPACSFWVDCSVGSPLL